MADKEIISDHYTLDGLLDRLRAALVEDGVDPDAPSLRDLAYYDQFHGRGLEATLELGDLLAPGPRDHLLDVGCGLGGPARILADRFGCRVTGIDLTESFVEAARRLVALLRMDDRVDIVLGNALSMPFGDAAFDGAYSMNVSMNIADKAAFYKEIFRVLKPGAKLVLSEVAVGPTKAFVFPTPWAATPESSFLSTKDETITGLEQAGFTVVELRDTVAENRSFAAKSRAMVKEGKKPPHRAVPLIHGPIARDMMANMIGGVEDGTYIPIEVLCRKMV